MRTMRLEVLPRQSAPQKPTKCHSACGELFKLLHEGWHNMPMSKAAVHKFAKVTILFEALHAFCMQAAKGCLIGSLHAVCVQAAMGCRNSLEIHESIDVLNKLA